MGNSKGLAKKVVIFSVIAAIILFLVVVIFILLGVIFLFPNNTIEGPLADKILGNQPGSVDPNYPVPPAEDLWKIITLPLVETNCLSAAKTQAGDLAWAVTSCSCTETKTLVEKNYTCTVFAIDGPHDLGLNCVKEQGNCSVTSEQGNVTFTFEELYRLAS